MAIRERPTGPQNDDVDAASKKVPTEQELLRKLKTYLSMKVITSRGMLERYRIASQDKDYSVERNSLIELIVAHSMLPEAFLLGITVATSTFLLLSRLPRLGMALGQQSPRLQGGRLYRHELEIPPGEEKSFLFFSMITNVMLFLPLSLMMGGTAAQYVILHVSDHKVIAEQLSKLPLLPGRSFLSDEICPTLIEATSKIKQCQLKPFRSKELRHYMTFAHNCQARRYYEQIIREEREISASSLPVIVSLSGVPTIEEQEYELWSEQAVLDQEEARRPTPSN
jgi:hypothetical protein